MKPMLSTKQVAEMLNVSLTTASKIMQQAGAIDAGFGKSHLWRIHQSDLDKFLAERKAKSEPAVHSAPPKRTKARKAVDYCEINPATTELYDKLVAKVHARLAMQKGGTP